MRTFPAYLLIVCSITLLVSSACESGAKARHLVVEDVSIVDIDSSDEPPPFSCASVENLYSIDMQDLNGYYAKIYVYVSNKDSIYGINNCIQMQFENRYKQVLSIWYLDKKNFAKEYVRAIDDKDISNEEFEQMDKHLIATFDKFAGKEGHWDFNQ